MVCRDISNFYPSCDTEKCLEAVKKLLETRECNLPSTECILEAFEITIVIKLSSNSTRFNDRFFTQVDGSTTGSPDSGSATDIFGAIHIDKKFIKESPRKPENYKRYRDDTIDIIRNSSEEEQKQITEWMNNSNYPNNIVFKIESILTSLTIKYSL